MGNPTPIKIIKSDVSAIEVAKYYLKVELSKLFPNIRHEEIENSINTLKESKILPLLEAISFTYHLNGVYYNITRDGYIWNEEEWDVENLIYFGMDTNINKLISSSEIGGKAPNLRDYLLNYFKNFPNDPENLSSLKPTNKKIEFSKLLLREKEGKILTLDGSHRLTEMLLQGYKTVQAYVAHPIDNKVKDTDRKVVIGSSTFILLTILYKNGSETERSAVETIVKQLIARSTDGIEQVQKFWIDRQEDEEIKNSGKNILSQLIG